jgi:hypothetical protein
MTNLIKLTPVIVFCLRCFRSGKKAKKRSEKSGTPGGRVNGKDVSYLAYTPLGDTTLAGPPVIPTGGIIMFIVSPFTFSETFFACISTPC